MGLLHRISNLFRNLFRKRLQEQDLNEEVGSYLEMLIEKKVREGFDPRKARRLALIELGGVEQIKDKIREARMSHYVETLTQDVFYGLRMLPQIAWFHGDHLVNSCAWHWGEHRYVQRG